MQHVMRYSARLSLSISAECDGEVLGLKCPMSYLKCCSHFQCVVKRSLAIQFDSEYEVHKVVLNVM